MLAYKVVMIAALYYPAVLKHHYSVGVAHGGEPVRYHEHGTVLHQAVHTPFYVRLGAGVYA